MDAKNAKVKQDDLVKEVRKEVRIKEEVANKKQEDLVVLKPKQKAKNKFKV
jgi:hypothetical protein